MQTQPHTSLVTILVTAMFALVAAAPVAMAAPPAEAPSFPSAVPSQPGALTGPSSDTTAARAQEQYYTSHGEPTPLSPVSAPVDTAGVDWATIGISLGGTFVLAGALIALVTRTRRRAGRAHVAA